MQHLSTSTFHYWVCLQLIFKVSYLYLIYKNLGSIGPHKGAIIFYRESMERGHLFVKLSGFSYISRIMQIPMIQNKIEITRESELSENHNNLIGIIAICMILDNG